MLWYTIMPFLFHPDTVDRPQRFDSGLTCPLLCCTLEPMALTFILFFYGKRSPQTTVSAHEADFIF